MYLVVPLASGNFTALGGLTQPDLWLILAVCWLSEFANLFIGTQ